MSGNEIMNQPNVRGRLPWGPVVMTVGFTAIALGVLSHDGSPVRAQDKSPARTKQAAAMLDAASLSNLIDREIDALLKAEKVPASGPADDAEFFRRIHLDLVSVVPTAAETSAFLDNTDPEKRAKAIDRLLDDPRFGRFQAELWANVLVPRDSNNRLLDRKPFLTWLADRFNKNAPLDQLVHDLLTAKGPQDQNGAVTYFIANPTVDKLTDTASRMFLGVQLQCAQCHNHPFTDWKQSEYWGMAQFFSKVRVTLTPQQAAKKGESPVVAETNFGFFRKGAQPEGQMKVKAKFLAGEEPRVAAAEPYRPVLANWLQSPENPFFARAMVNRAWHHLFGRGLVNPVDDMHENNLPTHPALLDVLSEQLKASGFDSKRLVRAICNSQAYQRTSRPVPGNGDDRLLYSHRLVRTMLPEQLYESVVAVTGRDTGVRRPFVAAIAKKGPFSPRDQFINFFRVAEEVDVLEYQQGIPQALRLMNSSATNSLGEAVSAAIKTAGAGETDKMIEQLYLRALSRRPTEAETLRLTSFVREHPVSPIAAYSDILWSMLNSSEFVLNH